MELVRSAPDVTTLADAVPIPGLGFVPVNAFLLQAQQPVLVDSGLAVSSPEFLEKLGSLLDPADLRWIYLTHPDRDHTGSIRQLFELAPSAKLVTTFLGMGILSMDIPVPQDRVFLLNPGQSLDLGDRQLTCFRPPLYDSPVTTGFYDSLTGTCFSSDCFGSPVASAELAYADDIAAVPRDELAQGQRLWSTVDSPWVTSVDRTAFRASLEPMRRLAPPVVLSSHLPAAHDATTRLLDTLEQAPDASPYVGPDQAALEAMLAEMEPATG